MTPKELLKVQTEIQALSNDFDAYYADWQGAKVRFVNLTKKFTNVAAPMQHEIPQAGVSAQPTEEHASTADDFQPAEENASSRAGEETLDAEEIARHPLVVRLKKLKRSEQLHQLRLKKIN